MVIAGRAPKKAQPEKSVEDSHCDSFSFHGDSKDEGNSLMAQNIVRLQVVLPTSCDGSVQGSMLQKDYGSAFPQLVEGELQAEDH